MDELLKELAANGPLAVICAVLLFRDWNRDQRDGKREERREVLEKERIEADKDLARSMTLLAERIK